MSAAASAWAMASGWNWAPMTARSAAASATRRRLNRARRMTRDPDGSGQPQPVTLAGNLIHPDRDLARGSGVQPALVVAGLGPPGETVLPDHCHRKPPGAGDLGRPVIRHAIQLVHHLSPLPPGSR